MILAVKLAFWALLVAAAFQDMRELKIANWISVALVALFPAWVFLIGFQWDIWQNLALCAIVFLGGTLLFALRWLGGGDVKLLAAAALWFDFAAAPSFLMSIALAGGALVIVLYVLRRLLPASVGAASGWKLFEARGPIPYGIAIAAGAILCSTAPGFNPQPSAPPPLAKMGSLPG